MTIAYTDKTVSPGESYAYTVDARNAAGASAGDGPVDINVPASGTRDPTFWPGQDSPVPWPNQPVGTGAIYTPTGILAARTGNNAVKSQEIPMNMDASQPVTPVYPNVGQQGCRCAPTSSTPLGSARFNPKLIIPSSGDNYPSVFLGSDNASRWEGGNTANCALTGDCAPGGNVTAGHFGKRGTITDDAIGGACGGSKLSTLYGTIRYLEFTKGTNGIMATVAGYTFATIRHCLRIDLSVMDLSASGTGPQIASLGGGPGWRWPAQTSDGGDGTGYQGAYPDLCEGSLLAIPQTINLNTLGLNTKPGKQLAWTFMYFGARPCNTQNGLLMAIATEWSALGRVAVAPPLVDTGSEFYGLFGFPMYASASSAFGEDINIITSNLAVIKNDSATNIGGGGTPLTALAPPLAA